MIHRIRINPDLKEPQRKALTDSLEALANVRWGVRAKNLTEGQVDKLDEAIKLIQSVLYVDVM